MGKLYCAMMDIFIQLVVPTDLHTTVIFIGIYFVIVSLFYILYINYY